MATKKIKILTSGPISIKGYIWGPVLTPYNEETDVIFKMISSGIKVVEVTDDGDVELTIESLTKDNSKESRELEKAKDQEAKRLKEEIKNKEKAEKEAKRLAEEEAKKVAAEEAERLAKLQEVQAEEEKNDVKVIQNNSNNKNYKKNR